MLHFCDILIVNRQNYVSHYGEINELLTIIRLRNQDPENLETELRHNKLRSIKIWISGI